MTHSSRKSDGLRPWAIAAAAMAGALLMSGQALAAPVQTTGANSIDSSGNNGQGIEDINQDAGAANNQANVSAISFAPGDNNDAITKIIAQSVSVVPPSDDPPTLQTNSLTNSFNSTAGIAQVNQATGRGNVQLNIVAVAFAGGATFSPALTDVELQGVTGPVSTDPNATGSAAAGSSNTISNSFNGFRGIAQVQQIAGDQNVVTNVVAIAVGTGG